jgi:hypothetical protein
MSGKLLLLPAAPGLIADQLYAKKPLASATHPRAPGESGRLKHHRAPYGFSRKGDSGREPQLRFIWSAILLEKIRVSVRKRRRPEFEIPESMFHEALVETVSAQWKVPPVGCCLGNCLANGRRCQCSAFRGADRRVRLASNMSALRGAL